MQCIADPESLSPADNERMYAFLKKHLELDAAANTTETAVPPVPCKQLTVTRTGQLASDGLSGAVFLPDIVRGATEALESKRAAYVERFAASPDGALLAFTGHDGTVLLSDARRGC